VPLATEHRKEARRAPVSKPLRPHRMPVALQAKRQTRNANKKAARRPLL
jgi:hypothetical protein